MRIAIIGSGIAGLGSAWLLHREHDVTIFEAAGYPGGHTNTVDVGGRAVDTGFIVYNERNYPRLRALFRELGVATRASDMSFGVSMGDGALEWAGDDWRKLFAQRRNLVSPSHWRMIADILRFNRQAKALLAANAVPDVDLGTFLDANRYGAAFRDRYLLPMGAAIWSAPTNAMTDFPASGFLRFFDNHGLLDLRDRPRWRTVVGGSRRYVERLLDAVGREHLHLGRPVRAVQRSEDGVRVTDGDGRTATFDRVVLATHADTALALLADADADERRVLGAFRFQPNRAVLHDDPALMPRRRAVWSAWNYLAGRDAAGDRRVSVTYWMNRLQGLPPDRPFFVSLTPLREPDPARVIREIEYDHPLFDRGTAAAQAALMEVQGRGGVWYCGAWCGYGFHEDGLAAAERVARGLGVTPPWGDVDG